MLVPKSKKNKGDKDKLLYAFAEHDGEDEKYPDANQKFVYLKERKDRAISLSESVFNFGFTIDGRFYYIKPTAGIFSKNWTNDFDSIMAQAREIPKAYMGINNLCAEAEELYRDLDIAYNTWTGKQWAKSETIGTGLHGATVRRVEAYISRHATGINYQIEMSEVKGVIGKLKGILKAMEMQHASVVATIYHTRKSNDVFSSSAGGMVNSIVNKEREQPSSISLSADEPEEDVISFDIEDSTPPKKKTTGGV